VIDLLVAGGGPAGLATALYADRAGLDVVVVEPRLGAIDKACGEGLMPGAVAALHELAIRPAGRPLRGIRYTDGGRSVDALFRAGSGLGVRRLELHRALRDAVHARGIPVHAASVDAVDQDDRAVTAAGVQARYLAAADGLHSTVRRRVGLDVPARGTPRFGLRRHFPVGPWTDLVEVHWAEHGEAYVTPVAPDLVGVAVLTDRRGSFEELMAGFPLLADRLGPAAAASTRTRGAGPLRQRSRARVAGRVLLVGDAAGYVDALTGEGIAIGLASARALVSCVVADDPRSYEDQWRRATRRYRRLTESLLWARNRPAARSAIVPVAARLPRAFGLAVDQLAR
jgi:flavin-dependent dehydrogenase